MKRSLALVLSLLTLLTLLAGCDFGAPSGNLDLGNKVDADNGDTNVDADNGNSDNDDTTAVVSNTVEKTDKLVGKNGEDISYVLIYNPNIYNEEAFFNKALNTGSLSSQIDVEASRGDGLEEPEKKLTSVDQGILNKDLPLENLDIEGNRGDILSPSYNQGDKASFYAFTGFTMNFPRNKVEFTCSYAGEYCNIWTYDVVIPSSYINTYGKEFDSNIYNAVITTFGMPRFNGKINLMIYSMPSDIGGCFTSADIFATGEVTEEEVDIYALNLNHNMLHINADLATYPGYEIAIKGTMAHEFQHLICMTNYFETVNSVMTGVWLNEAMSGYIEENLYPGSKDQMGHLNSFYKDSSVKHGQSIYNFSTDYDIAVYGSVYLFSEYFANVAGKDVFFKLHEYWRSSYSSTLDDAEALANAVPKTLYNRIDKVIEYPSSVSFETEYQEWMSKLMLDFYLSIIKYDSNDPKAFKNVDVAHLLYDEVNGTSIEGGGRIFIATSAGTFEIPDDADNGLIYVGLNSDFEVVTNFIYH